MDLECYPMVPRPPDIVPGRPDRAWMDKFSGRHPYRCLPLTMANTTGWEILCPMSFTAEWNGGPGQHDITLTADRPHPDFKIFVESHFSGGVVTFHTGYLFRTPPGWTMWTTGAPNHVKDGIQPLTGLVETDWLPFPFTMNWIFTRPGRVRFEKGEPFCFITLNRSKQMDDVQPRLKTMESDPVLRGQFDAWNTRRGEFNKRLYARDPATMKEAWQRFYFKGELPDDTGPAPAEHVNKRRLKPLKPF
ncbi:MAG TPA: DUF6065 family protein [Caulobacteraceae bacterium]